MMRLLGIASVTAWVWLIGTTLASAQVVITVGDSPDDTSRPVAETSFVPGEAGSFRSQDAAMLVTLPAALSGEAILVEHPRGGEVLAIEQVAAVQRDAAGAVLQRHSPNAAARAEQIDSHTVRYRELYPGTDDEYRLSYGQLKHDWVLTQQPTLPAAAVWFGYEVRLTLSPGTRLEGNATRWHVEDDEGEVLFELPAIVAVDAAGREHTGHYRELQRDGNEVTLGIEVEAAWLANASYPVQYLRQHVSVASNGADDLSADLLGRADAKHVGLHRTNWLPLR